MKREHMIAILMADKCTKNEAERFIRQNEVMVFEEGNLFGYWSEYWRSEEGCQDFEDFRKMVDNGVLAPYLSHVIYNNVDYYIEYGFK